MIPTTVQSICTVHRGLSRALVYQLLYQRLYCVGMKEYVSPLECNM